MQGDDDESELELYYPYIDDFMTEKLYDQYGTPYINKKLRKIQDFKESVRMTNTRLRKRPT